MDESPVIHSEYLQNRLRVKKAEGARGSRHHYYQHNHGPTGRDDGIFDVETECPPNRRISGKRNGPSPAGPPISYRHEDRTQSRRASGVSNSTQPRTMGAREMEEHVDKLSKQNFDLKLEVYHRREKIEELEKRLQDVPRLEEENAELVEVNSDLLLELERRDRAVDEAVVIICGLEEKVRRLEEELVQTRPSTAQPTTVSTNSSGARVSPAMPRGRKSDSPPPIKEKRHAPRSGVSPNVLPNVSARLAELASPQRSAGRPQLMPSFLSNHEPSTDALRRLFVEGNQKLRPVPSYATLMSTQTEKEDDEAIDDGLYSPKLSALSDSDLRSLYGSQQSPAPFESPSRESSRDISNALESTSSTSLSRERRLARTNRWVAARAVSPSKTDQSPRAFSPDVGQFRSLEDVLCQDNGGGGLDFPTKDRTKESSVTRIADDKTTPQTTSQHVFGPNVYPPTPDTLVTRPLNHSTSSIIPGKSLLDGTPAPRGNYSSMIPMVQPAQLVRSHAHSTFVPGNSMLPKDFDAYEDSASSDGEHELSRANAEFGVAIFQGYNSDGSLEYTSSKKHSRDQSSLTGSTMIGAESQQDLKTVGFIRNSPSPPPLLNTRTRSTQLPTQVASSSRPIPFPPPKNSDMYLPDRLPFGKHNSTARTPTGTTTQQSHHGRQLSHPSTVLDRPESNPYSHSHKHANDIQALPAVATPTSPRLDDTSRTASIPHLPRRAASLRARVAKLGRRTSTSTSTSASDHKAVPPERSESITQRLFRRNHDDTASLPLQLQRNSNATEDAEFSDRPAAPAYPETSTQPPISPPPRSSSLAHSRSSARGTRRSLDRANGRGVYSSLSMSATGGRVFTPSIAASDEANESTIVVHRTPVASKDGRPRVKGRHSSWRSGESVEVVAYPGRDDRGREQERGKETWGRGLGGALV